MADQKLNARTTLALSDVVAGDWLAVFDTSADSTLKLDAAALKNIAIGAQENFIANDTLTAAETGKLCTNIGATGAVVLTLPAAAANLWFRFMRVAAFALRIQPPAGAAINDGTVDKYVELTATGNLTLRSYDATGGGVWRWYIDNDVTWNYQP